MPPNKLAHPRLSRVITSAQQLQRERERILIEIAEVKERALETLIESQELLRDADQILARR